MAKINGVIYAVWCFLSIAVVVILFYIVPKKNYKIRKIWAKIQRFVIGYKIEKIGEFDEKIDMILLNHKSMLDIIILEEIYPKNLAWVAKKEIGDLPFFGKIIKTPKMIEVDRKNSRSIVSLIKDVKDRLSNDRVIAIFPEGTRGRGEKMLKFQDGAKVLSQKLKLKIQPIVLKDTLYNFDVKEVKIRSGKIKVNCLEMIDLSKPQDENWYKNLHEVMQKTYDEM
ncbi:1-acylglycerol-3-phosphate O-acyltransferase [Campylobacter ureolyticus ACS-301-V-Sch3b]|uniref:1-acyl-sn-glycerol-3-phosphate acyltransferase n=1 Tax=Campylobacter ureolyticus ACS-301-V-Sch3b TaxID=883165 RepID=S3XXY6_9BACT|nr:lysophospholipid acyltransferase family protein [Campylobacter ureolyticus]EPH10248.1 1-acylglycerol-3-phosphate O-acyltransferase [Campylobacter ureolyticus ACS-301-V-Sch3b]